MHDSRHFRRSPFPCLVSDQGWATSPGSWRSRIGHRQGLQSAFLGRKTHALPSPPRVTLPPGAAPRSGSGRFLVGYRGPRPRGPSVVASGTVPPSPSAFPLFRGCLKRQGGRSPLRALGVPGSASAGAFRFTPLLPTCTTRDRGLVGPSPAGTLTLPEAPSFAWRTDVQRQRGREARFRSLRLSHLLFPSSDELAPAMAEDLCARRFR